MVKKVDREYFKNFFKESVKPHVIKMFSDTCSACRDLEPDYDRLAKELGDEFTFVKFDVSTDEKVSDVMAPDGVPTIHFFKEGRMYEIDYGDGYSYDYLKDSILNETNLKKD
jgi:thioredoxin domain-containing protein 5|tara:strand:+ start:214 stop:549 length:336 start_codon:yes stop_codon:yes gene_type:complete